MLRRCTIIPEEKKLREEHEEKSRGFSGLRVASLEKKVELWIREAQDGLGILSELEDRPVLLFGCYINVNASEAVFDVIKDSFVASTTVSTLRS